MSPELIALLFGALLIYSAFFIQRAAHTQQVVLLPFLYRLHAPNVIQTLSDEEHHLIHDKIDEFNLRILACFLAAVIAFGSTAMFLMLLFNGGDPKVAGYISAVLFAFIGANYDVSPKIVSWVRASENELLARVMQRKADDGGFDSLADYLQAENDKMLEEALEEFKRTQEEFEQIAIECGWDPDKNYEESDESIEELYDIMDKTQQKIDEIYSEPTEK